MLVYFVLGCILTEFVLYLWYVLYFLLLSLIFLIGIMEKLDQGHLHPLHVPAWNRTRCKVSTS
jgi:hypothetical protein